jgi:hypothetical protein
MFQGRNAVAHRKSMSLGVKTYATDEQYHALEPNGHGDCDGESALKKSSQKIEEMNEEKDPPIAGNRISLDGLLVMRSHGNLRRQQNSLNARVIDCRSV